jgi:hypothetical protein
MTSILRNKKIMVTAWLGVALLALLTAYGWFSKETVIYENSDIDGYGFTALVTCRPDVGFTYYPSLVIKTPRGMEVSRSQLNALGYEAFQACRNSFPVARLEMDADKHAVRVHFTGRNAFGDRDTLDVPIQYFSPR